MLNHDKNDYGLKQLTTNEPVSPSFRAYESPVVKDSEQQFYEASPCKETNTPNFLAKLK